MKNLDESPRTENTEPVPILIGRQRPESENPQSLLTKQQIEELQSRWGTIQAAFVDEPTASVKDADALVESAIQQMSAGFANQRTQLEKQWRRGDDVSTEDLRLAMQRYRSLFTRLVSI